MNGAVMVVMERGNEYQKYKERDEEKYGRFMIVRVMRHVSFP